MKLKNEKGSITIFVLVGLLFMSAFLIISYASNINKSKVIKEQLEIINTIYQMRVETTKNIYDKITSMPIINDLPEVIFVGVDRMEDYIDSGDGEQLKQLEFIIDEKLFNLEEDMNNYIKENNAYGEKEITITVTNSRGNTTTRTQTIIFKEITNPVIEKLPNIIITNVTQIKDYYVSYDDLGKKEENYTIVGINEIFNSMVEVAQYTDKWLIQNSQYEVEIEIKIIATGNNNLTSELTQTVKFIKGVSVTNEMQLNTALASTAPSYIQIANNIICNSTINIDGVTHKLDLNNNTVSKTVVNESFTFINLGSNANLTIIDSSSTQEGKLIAKLSEPNYDSGTEDERLNTIYTINNQGILNIESGTVASDLLQKVGEPKKNIHVKDLAKTIKNSGTVNLNGGNITSNAVTQGASHVYTRNGEATAIGIENTGTVNLNNGKITCYAEANMKMTLGTYGETRAYAYGVTNSGGTVNRDTNVTISVTAIANDDDSYTETKDSAEIKNV